MEPVPGRFRGVPGGSGWFRAVPGGSGGSGQVPPFTYTQQIQPQAIFAGAHIDKFEGCTFNINVFCGDQSKIARLNDNLSLNDRGTNWPYLHCKCTFGHFS